MAKNYKPVVLLILDGFGVSQSTESTWTFAQMPTFRELEKYYPFTTLQASGTATGLPWGEEGNSEVGHLTIGAGRPIFHHLPRIIMSIHDHSFFQNQALLDAANFARTNNGKFHIMGLASSGSVHAYIDHLYALLTFATEQKLNKIYLHLFTDGRDAPTKEAAKFVLQLEERLTSLYPMAKIASIIGRDFAMDRDGHWDRIEKTYKSLTDKSESEFSSASSYIEASYKNGITDEFINPATLQGNEGKVEDGDAMIFYNFREDSVRELTSAFISDDFSSFPREKLKNLFFVTMTEYDSKFPAHVAFPPLDIPWPLARVISEAGLTQLHIAETDKYAHVTYFFNGGKEAPFRGESRVLVPSPQNVHFDEVPEMAIEAIANEILKALPQYDFILVNFANGDMVGHTGNLEATVKAIEIMDKTIAKIYPEVFKAGGAMIITADHGNAEEKVYAHSGEKRTKHTANPVPMYVLAPDLKNAEPKTEEEIRLRYADTKGVISDVAPTVLALMGLPKKGEMVGINLLPKIS
ncbi:MAG: 2,3-bisphosphoglycerate-independent phosphoglycerate mutase [bacterium]|nr:2,3-bisphosphoglycerate-independent phosphoglycerate mutase [bacterium]